MNQRMTVEKIIKEPLTVNHIYKDKKQLESRVDELLEAVGLNATYRKKYPPEISGGQRQRVAIARCIALQPDFVIADEPIASLDVSIQAQIINLFKHLQTNTNSLFYLLPMTLQLYDISVIKLECSIMENWWRLLLRKSCLRIRFILIQNHCCQQFLHRIQGRKKIKYWFRSMGLPLQVKEK